MNGEEQFSWDEKKGLSLRDLAKGQVDIPEPPREKRTSEELAGMIRTDLSKVDGCPERGVNVTVYGIPWRAMLMFGVEAGPVRNSAELRQFFDIITERLQRLYDVA